MVLLRNIWNGKFSGLLGACIILVARVFNAMRDGLNTLLVKNNIGQCGKGVVIQCGFVYRNPSNIVIGNNVKIGKNVSFLTELSSGKLIINNNVVIGRDCHIEFSGTVIIEDLVLFSEGVNIQTHDHGLDPRSKPIGKQLIIKERAWIGMNATVLSNTSVIGKNSIVAANSVVTREVDNNAIIGGIPSKVIKMINKDGHSSQGPL